MITIKVEDVIKWLKCQRNDRVFKYANEPACLFTAYARYLFKDYPYALCERYGNIRATTFGLDLSIIAKVPFHNVFWESSREYTKVTAIKRLEMIKSYENKH